MSRLNDKDPVSRQELLDRWDAIRKRVHINKEIAELIDAGNALADSLEIWEEVNPTPATKADVESFLNDVGPSLDW